MSDAVTDLTTLLRTMRPERRPGEYVFVVATSVADVHPLAMVEEDEGRSLVLARSEADRLGLAYEYVGAWITLRVRSALAAVGLTAAVSAALTRAGISCNVIAGYHHDHLVVPVGRADDALRELSVLSTG